MANQKPSLAATVALMKAQVLSDIATGQVPRTVESFSELHDYVDANEYGGFCDGAIVDTMIASFGGRDEHEGLPSGFMEFMNAAQETIDTWLRSTHMDEAQGISCRAPIEIDPYYSVQEFNHKGGNWVNRLDTKQLGWALEHCEHYRAQGLAARVVVVSRTVIA